MPLAVIETKPEPPGLGEEDASASLEVALKSQGASFDKDGFLWLSQSDSETGALRKVDPKTGKVLAKRDPG